MHLDGAAIEEVAKFYTSSVLWSDQETRSRGMDDEDFDALGAKLVEQRQTFGRMLAQGKTIQLLPAFQQLLLYRGVKYAPAADEAQAASYQFAKAVVETLDLQLKRQEGGVVDVQHVEAPRDPFVVAFPSGMAAAPAGLSWEVVFECWRDYVPDRPKSTTAASNTAWKDLCAFATGIGKHLPNELTPLDMTAFVDGMVARNLSIATLNGRLDKIRQIYKIAAGRHLLEVNPAAHTLGRKKSGIAKRAVKRLPFDVADLETLFGSEVFTRHTRSQGQSGEASYWIPLLMYYSGARPEELAGLALRDIVETPHGWLFDIVDRPEANEDQLLFSSEDEAAIDGQKSQKKPRSRVLKNAPSIRKVPVAQELIDLGLLRYIDVLRAADHVELFPTLEKDWHGKLSGSFSKFFGRYKVDIGITDPRKVLYSFRHTMKDFLEAAGMPTKYLQRILGHTSGDGAVTDGYGSDLPFERVAMHFSNIRFPKIPAAAWKPGQGTVRFRRKCEGNEEGS